MAELFSKELKRINYLSAELDAAYHEAALKLGLADSACIILYTMRSNGGSCLLRDIISLGISKQTVNSALRKLEKENIVYLETIYGNRRNICLTETGKRKAEETVDRILKIENEIFDSWSQEDLEKYIELGQRFLMDFRGKIKEL